MSPKALRDLVRLLGPLRRRVASAVGRAVVQSLDDGSPVQGVKILAGSGEILAKVERIQQFGFTGAAPEGSDAVLVCVGGIRTHAIVVACEHREHRKRDLAEGESAVYDAFDKYIYLREDGTIEIRGEDLEITVEEGDQGGGGKITVKAEGDVEVETAAPTQHPCWPRRARPAWRDRAHGSSCLPPAAAGSPAASA